MSLDNNTTAILNTLITLILVPFMGWLFARNLKKSQAVDKAEVVAAVATVQKETKETKEELTAVKVNINGMRSELVKSKEETATAQIEAAGLTGEAKGRAEGAESAVVETVKGSNGELAALKKDIKIISEKLADVPTPAPGTTFDLAALAKMLAAEMKKDQK